MNKEEIIKELDKQNKQLGVELSLTKDKLNKTLFILDKIKEEIKKYKYTDSWGDTVVLAKYIEDLLEEME